MRILSLAAVFAVLAVSVAAHADATAGPGQCVQADTNGCGCTQEFCSPPLPPDQATPVLRDLSAPRDLTPSPPDARRQRQRQRNRAHGRGLVLLSGLSVLAVAGLRRRYYKANRPTPADSALAARATRKDS